MSIIPGKLDDEMRQEAAHLKQQSAALLLQGLPLYAGLDSIGSLAPQVTTPHLALGLKLGTGAGGAKPSAADCATRTPTTSVTVSPTNSITTSPGDSAPPSPGPGSEHESSGMSDDAQYGYFSPGRVAVQDEKDCVKVSWPVDSRKLRAKDLLVVSPTFNLFPGVPFKLMIKPRLSGNKKGQSGFATAGGRGHIQFKCEAHSSMLVSPVEFRLSIGSSRGQQRWRGPFRHNFSENPVAALPKHLEEWDLSSAVNRDQGTLTIHLEVSLPPVQVAAA
jgi:hypothetical protein